MFRPIVRLAWMPAVLVSTLGLAGAVAAQAPAPKVAPAEAAAAAPAAQPKPALKVVPAPPPAPSLPVVPSPGATAEEARHVARLDAAIASAREHKLSSDDAQKVREAIAAFAANDQVKARSLAAQISDPVASKLVDWYRLRVGIGEPKEYTAFLEQNPSWPERKLLIQRREEAIFAQGGSAQTIRSYFAKEDPQTGIGSAALASAFQVEGNEKAAIELVRKAWREQEIAATFEAGFLERFAARLTNADHKARFDRLTVDDIRWSGERNEKGAFARRTIPLLSEADRAKAEARLAVFLKAANAQALIDALPAEPAGEKPDWGLAYHRIQVLRRSGREDDAVRVMLQASTDPALVANLDAWWEERRQLAYAMLRAGKARVAYDLVKVAGPLGVNALKDQLFMAGWLALRHLKDAKAAAGHFEALRKAADGPLSLSKAHYWLGRTADAQGDTAAALEHYKAGAKFPDTFHGQISRARVEPGARPIPLPWPEMPATAEVEAFNKLDAVRAAVVARRSSIEPMILRAFLINLGRNARTEGEAVLITHLAEALGDVQAAVRIAKLAVGRGFRLFNYSYPLHPMPAYQPVRQPPETALLLAIARQESEFNPQTVSGAGARGILQVMPVTAKHVCRDYRIKCELDRLLRDPAYNTSIASAYITDRMAEFQGSYILTFAGYNAGPGRTRQWIREFGDPRDPAVDPVDWIMRIPFEETREYVQKVLSNVQIYRARLGEAQPLRIGEDLARARSATRATDPAGTPAPAEPPPVKESKGAQAAQPSRDP